MNKFYQPSTEYKGSIVLDIGVAYTKIGLAGKNAPTKILKTPCSLFKQIKDIDVLVRPAHLIESMKNVNPNSNQNQDLPSNDKENLEQYKLTIKQPLEEFLNLMFFHEILVKPANRSIYICEKYLFPRVFYDILAEMLFEKFQASKVYFLLSHTLPLYLTSLESGIVIECNYMNTQITPVYDGYAVMDAFSSEDIGGFKVSYTLKQEIVKRFSKQEDVTTEQVRENISKTQQFSLLNKYLNFVSMEDMKFKYCKLLSFNQRKDFFSSPENVQKMKETLINFTAQKIQKIPISYYEVTIASEILFGDVENEELNVAYTFLQSLLKLEYGVLKKTIQNVVFSGGVTQMRGFTSRFREELLYFLDNFKEFERIKFVKDDIRFTNIVYPPNILNWLGASIVGSLQGTEMFCVTDKQYKENNNTIPDRFGVAYLFGNREATYIAPEIEQAEIL